MVIIFLLEGGGFTFSRLTNRNVYKLSLKTFMIYQLLFHYQ